MPQSWRISAAACSGDERRHRWLRRPRDSVRCVPRAALRSRALRVAGEERALLGRGFAARRVGGAAAGETDSQTTKPRPMAARLLFIGWWRRRRSRRRSARARQALRALAASSRGSWPRRRSRRSRGLVRRRRASISSSAIREIPAKAGSEEPCRRWTSRPRRGRRGRCAAGSLALPGIRVRSVAARRGAVVAR